MLRIHAGGAHHRGGALPGHNVTGPSAEVCVTGNSNPDFELFGGVAKGVK
jgi:hypothetical protein